MRLRLYHHHDGARVAYRETGAGPGAGAAALAGALAPRVGADRRAAGRRASASCCPICRCTATPRTARAIPYTPDWLAEVIAGFCREVVRAAPAARRPRHRRRARAARGRHRAADAVAAGADAQPAAPPRGASAASARRGGRSCRAAALPGLDRVLAHGAKLVFRPAVGERLSVQRNPAARDLVRHAFADVGGNGNRARSWAKFARRWPRGAQR